jgi:hypothetical protein
MPVNIVADMPDFPGRRKAPKPRESFILGLDLGQAQDYSALAIDQVTELPPEGDKPPKRHHAIRHLQRWPLKTSYLKILRDVAALVGKVKNPTLVIDGTGVGVAVVDLFRHGRLPGRLVSVTITAGTQTHPVDGGYSVAKKELVSSIQAAIQTRRLQVAPLLDEAATLKQELALFRSKVSTATGHESFEALRERDHDDLVLAVALAVWFGERGNRRVAVFA